MGDVGDGESDWYRVFWEILEFEYIGEPVKKVVLFYCEWYNPRHPDRTCKHNNYKIIQINHTKDMVPMIHLLFPKMLDKCIIYHMLESANRIERW